MLKKAHGDDAPAEFTAACGALEAQLRQWRTWDTHDYRHVVMRLLNCAPFSAFDLRDQVFRQPGTKMTTRPSTASRRPVAQRAQDMPLSMALGQLFDSVRLQRSLLRKWANLWCQWAFKYIMALAGHYNCSRGFDRRDVPCFNHRKRDATGAAALHQVDDLGRDACDVDGDSLAASDVSSDAEID